MKNENTKVPMSQQLVTALWAAIPMSILVTLLKMAGVTGALIPFICFFGFYVLVAKWRKEKVLKQTKGEMWKEVGIAFLVMIGLIFILPMAILLLTTDI